ncbi:MULTISPECIES: hypothetical protein [Clostridium]|uniref:Uncharacterized protein n=3 Tax=Clostridium TaxID=1485 RepID=A0ABY6SXY3_9CLOT|nr:hypothetical protein [Clostridium carnis]VDG73457.1 Uncharacterised protein [Clostridium carnis]
MTNRQLPDFLTAENDLDGQEPVYIAQGGKTRKTLLSKIKEFIIGTTELTTTDKSISGAIEEVKEIADNNTTQLKESAQNITNLQNNKANLISTPQCTTKDITLYVSQNGNDSNDGLTEGTAVRTIQRAIDYIPKNVKHITKINVAKGNYDEIVVLVGFYGDGEIYITGDIDLSDGHIVKRIISRRNKVFIKFFGIKIQCNDETSVYSENDDRFILEKCIIDSPIQATNFAGVHSIASLVEVTSCTINNRNQAIVSRLGGCVMSTTNQGTNNICGLNADTGAIIAKNGSQPSGTTAEVVYAGGVIR